MVKLIMKKDVYSILCKIFRQVCKKIGYFSFYISQHIELFDYHVEEIGQWSRCEKITKCSGHVLYNTRFNPENESHKKKAGEFFFSGPCACLVKGNFIFSTFRPCRPCRPYHRAFRHPCRRLTSLPADQ